MLRTLHLASLSLAVALCTTSAGAVPQGSGPPISFPLQPGIGGTGVTTIQDLVTLLQSNGLGGSSQNPLAVLKGGTGISIAEEVHTASYGSICDGQHHFLSGVTSYMGQNTTGWSVAQWQAMFPELPGSADLTAQELDGWAITTTFLAIKAGLRQAHMRVDGSKCLVSYPIDHTRVKFLKNLILDYSGVEIHSTAVGLPTVDMTGTASATLLNVYITGDCTLEPFTGILLARETSPGVTGGLTIDHPKTDYCFSNSGLLNVSTEVNLFLHPVLSNQDLSGGRAFVADGTNHYNVASIQKFDVSVIARDVSASFTQNTIISGGGGCSSCDAPVFLGATRQWVIDNTYWVNNSTAANKYGYILWSSPTGANTNLTINSRTEAYNGPTSGVTGTFYITSGGATSNASISSFNYTDAANWSSTALFMTDPSITRVTLDDIDVRIDGWAPIPGGGSPLVVDRPSIYNINGHVSVPTIGSYQPYPNLYSGDFCIAAQCTQVIPQMTLNRNSEFVYDSAWNYTLQPAGTPNLTQVSDAWIKHIDGTNFPVTVQDVRGNTCLGGEYGLQMTVTRQGVIGNTALVAVRSSILSTDLTPIWGSPLIPPFIVDVKLKANYNGVVSLFFMNQSGLFALVHEITLPSTVNTCQEYVFYLPQPPNGASFVAGQENNALFFGLAADCGAALQVAALDVWATQTTARSGFCGPDNTNFISTAGNQLNIDAFRVYGNSRINGSSILPIFLPWPDSLATHENLRSFEKSVPYDSVGTDGTLQNLGTQGAEVVTIGVAGNGVASQTGSVLFQTNMHGSADVPPTVTTASTSSASTNAWDTTSGVDCGPLAVTSSTRGFTYVLVPPAGVAARDVCRFNWKAQSPQ